MTFVISLRINLNFIIAVFSSPYTSLITDGLKGYKERPLSDSNLEQEFGCLVKVGLADSVLYNLWDVQIGLN